MKTVTFNQHLKNKITQFCSAFEAEIHYVQEKIMGDGNRLYPSLELILEHWNEYALDMSDGIIHAKYELIAIDGKPI